MQDQKRTKQKKYIMILSIIFLMVSFLFVFLWKNSNKISKNGNNNNETIEGVTESVLNMSSYEAKIEVTINSNKNTNQYRLVQYYVAPNLSKQIVEEPSNISGLMTTFDGENLKVQNTKLNLTTIYKHYQYLTENDLFLNTFIEDYRNNIEKSKVEETKDSIILSTQIEKNKNQYRMNKILYIDKKTGKPTKMEVQDVNQNVAVYILYNEIKINQTKPEEIVAFWYQNDVTEV